MRMTGINLVSRFLLLFSAALIVGCGGVDYGDEPVSSFTDSELEVGSLLVPNQSALDGQLFLSWSIEDVVADFYRVSVSLDGGETFELVADDVEPPEAPDLDNPPECDDPLTGGGVLPPDCEKVDDPTGIGYIYELSSHLFDWDNGVFLVEACTGDPLSPPVACEEIGRQVAQGRSAEFVGFLTIPTEDTDSGVVDATYGIAAAMSEDGDTLIVGANTATYFLCDEDDIIVRPAGYLNALGRCETVEAFVELEPIDCVIELPGDILPGDCEKGEPLYPPVNCDIDPDTGVFPPECEEKPPACEDSVEPGEILPPDCAAELPVVELPEGAELPILYEIISNAGTVYTYKRISGVWTLSGAPLKAPNAGENDFFGSALSISHDGTRIAVAAPNEASDAAAGVVSAGVDESNEEALSAGAVYVYTWVDDAWELETFLKASNAEENDIFGWDVAISGDGNTLAVSSPQEQSASTDQDDNSLTCSGAVYVYSFDELLAEWQEPDYLKAPTPQTNDVFGRSVSLDYTGQTLAVGASQFPESPEDPLDLETWDLLLGCDPAENPVDNTGAAHIFSSAGGTWQHMTELQASNADSGDRFGVSVALNSGMNFDGEGDGIASRLAVGATLETSSADGVNGSEGNDHLTPGAGAVYLFDKDGGGAWSQSQYVKASNPGATDQFGSSVSLSASGHVLAVGAWGEAGPFSGVNPNQDLDTAPATGASYVYVEDSDTLIWEQRSYVKPVAFISYMTFGWELQLSRDGKRLVVSSPAYIAPGEGAVFIY